MRYCAMLLWNGAVTCATRYTQCCGDKSYLIHSLGAVSRRFERSTRLVAHHSAHGTGCRGVAGVAALPASRSVCYGSLAWPPLLPILMVTCRVED